MSSSDVVTAPGNHAAIPEKGPLQVTIRNQRDRLLDMLNSKYPGYHPVLAMADMAHNPGVETEVQFQCHKTIARYVESELKAVEVKTDKREDYGTLRVIIDGEVDEVTPQQATTDTLVPAGPPQDEITDAEITEIAGPVLDEISLEDGRVVGNDAIDLVDIETLLDMST